MLRDPEDVFLAWILACFVPWARAQAKSSKNPTSKQPPSPASLAAREGIKADNKICKIVDDAVHSLQEIIALKDTYITNSTTDENSRKRKLCTDDRVIHGQAIRRWGHHWRCNVVYACLLQVSEVGSSSSDSNALTLAPQLKDLGDKILDSYAKWVMYLHEQDLLDVDHLKPIIDGKQLSKALDVKPGPWMKNALDVAMEWQLRNPDQKDPAGAIAEVKERKHEFGIS